MLRSSSVRFTVMTMTNKRLHFRFKPNLLPYECPKLKGFINSTSETIMLSGPVETSKTMACWVKLIKAHCRTPNLQSLVLRTAFADIQPSLIATLFNQLSLYDKYDKRLPFIQKGDSSIWLLQWKNGGETWLQGAENHRSKILGSEWDLIYYNQAESANENIFPDIMARASGRANNWFYADGTRRSQFIADVNPDVDSHFLLQMKADGKWDEWHNILHDSNPYLYSNGEYTQAGLNLLDRLERTYTGVQYLRKVKGLWRSAEGLVYSQYNPDYHDIEIRDKAELGDVIWIASLDFNIRKPMAMGLWAYHPQNKILTLFKEIYEHIPLVSEYIVKIKELLSTYDIQLNYMLVDHDIEHMNQLIEAGFDPVLADKTVLDGIESVKNRLKNGLIRFNVHSLDNVDESLTGVPNRLTQEINRFAYPQGGAGRGDLPDKDSIDHAMDHMRYTSQYVSGFSNEPIRLSYGTTQLQGV